MIVRRIPSGAQWCCVGSTNSASGRGWKPFRPSNRSRRVPDPPCQRTNGCAGERLKSGEVRRPLHVLLLEDRPMDAELIVHELKHAGFDPDWQRVENETEYLAALEPTLDVMLADFAM